jgi:hypothetical protein
MSNTGMLANMERIACQHQTTIPGFYDFTAASANAYGDNMTLKGTRWCLYSGDVDQDGTIDGTDLQEIDNDAYNFVFGQLLNTDLNGDDFVDGGDFCLQIIMRRISYHSFVRNRLSCESEFKNYEYVTSA